MKTNLVSKIGVSVLFPALALTLMLATPRLLSNDYNSPAKVVAQDTTVLDSLIIVGKVVDLDHVPLMGVVVKDSNSDMEKLTDIDGTFDMSFDKATMVSFTKTGFNKIDHKVIKSDSNLVVIMTPESNELILQGYASLAKKDEQMEWMDIDTTSTLRKKYEMMKDSMIDKSMKMDKWKNKMDSTHINKMNHIQMHDSMKMDSTSELNHDGVEQMDSTRVKKYLKQKADSLSRMDEKKKSWNDTIKKKETRMRSM